MVDPVAQRFIVPEREAAARAVQGFVCSRCHDMRMRKRVGVKAGGTSVCKVKAGETTDELFAFLTTEPNKAVGVIHPKAMPVILTTRKEIDLWMAAPAEEALRLQGPLADDALMIVVRGGKQDEGGVAAWSLPFTVALRACRSLHR